MNSYAAKTGLVKPIERPKSGVQKKNTPQDNRKRAQRLLMTWLTDEPFLYKKIEKYITASDFTDELYQKVAERLFTDLKEGKYNPAAIISMFTDEEEQREVAEIFNTKLEELTTPQEKEKAFHDILYQVKKNSYEYYTAQLGSDVPFCVRGGTALIRGRGEEVRKLAAMPPCNIVLCKPEISCATAEMYRLLDERTIESRPDTAGLTKALEVQDRQDISERLGNVFEQVLPPESVILAIKRELLALGARAACMSGSGSTVFGIFFEDEPAARAAAQTLRKKYPQTYLAENV